MMGARKENGGSHLFWFTHQVVLLLCCLCLVPSATQEGNVSCIVQPVEMYQDAVLTCIFPEDMNIIKKDFSVYHKHNFDAMIDCWWLRGNMSCSAEPGIVYPNSVSKTFQIHLINITSARTGTYACKVANYDPTLSQECQLKIKTEEKEGCLEGCENVPVAVGVSCGVVVVLALSSGLIFYLRRKRQGKNRKECNPLIEIENFLECMKEKNTDEVIQLCLCADDLSNPSSAWDVDSTVMDHLRRWWGRLMRSLGDGPTMTDDIYQSMISRLCGPATVSDFEISGESTCQLPRTLQQAVSMTGEFFEKFTLLPCITEMLEEPRMILSGPPGTGKTKTLALVGRKWISEGHVVCFINTWEEGSVANTKLFNLLQQTSAVQSSANPKQEAVISIFCNIKDKNEIDEAVTFLKLHAKGQPLFALADEPTFDKAKSEQVATFLQKLHENLLDLHMWVASCRADIVTPPGWRGKPLNIPLSCPPSVIREVWNNEDIAPYSSNTSLLPTDGLPVKNIHHRVREHKAKEPRDCDICGEEIARFLTKTLDVTGTDTSNTTDAGAAEDRQFPTLQWKDILILFERDVEESLSILKPLKNSGFQVQVIDSNDTKNVLKNNSNTVLAAKAGFSCGLKRKVVVYVEGEIERSESSAKWNRLFGVTSCTSQLVYVRMT